MASNSPTGGHPSTLRGLGWLDGSRSPMTRPRRGSIWLHSGGSGGPDLRKTSSFLGVFRATMGKANRRLFESAAGAKPKKKGLGGKRKYGRARGAGGPNRRGRGVISRPQDVEGSVFLPWESRLRSPSTPSQKTSQNRSCRHILKTKTMIAAGSLTRVPPPGGSSPVSGHRHQASPGSARITRGGGPAGPCLASAPWGRVAARSRLVAALRS